MTSTILTSIISLVSTAAGVAVSCIIDPTKRRLKRLENLKAAQEGNTGSGLRFALDDAATQVAQEISVLTRLGADPFYPGLVRSVYLLVGASVGGLSGLLVCLSMGYFKWWLFALIGIFPILAIILGVVAEVIRLKVHYQVKEELTSMFHGAGERGGSASLPVLSC